MVLVLASGTLKKGGTSSLLIHGSVELVNEVSHYTYRLPGGP